MMWLLLCTFDVLKFYSMKTSPMAALYLSSCVFGASYVVLAAPGTSVTPHKTPRELNLARVKTLDAKHLRECGSRTNFLVRPGLVADRSTRTIRMSAESIALESRHPVEFTLITLGSGKDYEAQSVSFASAADLHEALEFIGLRPGQNVNASAMRFWPKGDRVRITLRYPTPDSANHEPTNRTSRSFCEFPAEQLIIDSRTRQPLPENGFVFTGSQRISAVAPATGTVYVADAFSPGCIISLYNDPTTVLDVPRKASQHEVYGYQVPNPERILPQNALIEIILEPFFRDSQPHRFDYTLIVGPSAESQPAFALVDSAGTTINTNLTLNGFLATLDRLSAPDRDIFVVLRPDDALPLNALPPLAQLLSSLDTEKGIRLEAPPEGHPFYKAFFPNQTYRRREDRPAAATELHLNTAGGTTTGELVFVTTEWAGGDSAPVFHETRLPIFTPDQLTAALAARKDAPAVMLIFVSGPMTYGALRSYAAPLLKRYMVIYVFQ